MTLPMFSVEQAERTSDDFLTPAWIFDALNLKFDLDVASPPWRTHVPAREFYTKAQDGLAMPWFGRVWMNPPYSEATPWVDRFIAHRDGIALLPWAKSAWTCRIWAAADAIAGGSISYMVMFAAFGAECAEAIRRLGRVRRSQRVGVER